MKKQRAIGRTAKDKMAVSELVTPDFFLFSVFCVQHPWCNKPTMSSVLLLPFCQYLHCLLWATRPTGLPPCLQPSLPKKSYFLFLLKPCCNNSCFCHISKYL